MENPKPKNEKYTLTIKDPLLRPGLILNIGPFSKKYAVEVIQDAMEIVRKLNEEKSWQRIILQDHFSISL